MLVPVFAARAVPNGSNISVSFPTQPGFNYQLLYKSNLTDSAWTPVGNLVGGNGAVESVDVPTGDVNGFYRVQIQ